MCFFLFFWPRYATLLLQRYTGFLICMIYIFFLYTLRITSCILNAMVLFFKVLGFFLLQLYVVYMGSRGSDEPEEILRQNHQMLTVIHKGRYILSVWNCKEDFSFFNFLPG